MSVKKLCILEYVKRKTKATLQIFLSFYLASEAIILCRLSSKVQNDFKKKYIIYLCDFGNGISITHVYPLMEELYFEF